jgi:hypothetical protein
MSAGVTDFSGIRQHLGDGLTIAKWLEQQRSRLEAIVEPSVSRAKTQMRMLYRGQKVYLKPPFGDTAMHGVMGLQFLYQLQDAIAAGDINAAILAAMPLNGHLNEITNIERWKSASIAALAEHARSRERRRRGGLRSSILVDTPDIVLQAAYCTHKHRRNWLSATTSELRNKLGLKKLSAKTVSRELRKRAISDNG